MRSLIRSLCLSTFFLICFLQKGETQNPTIVDSLEQELASATEDSMKFILNAKLFKIHYGRDIYKAKAYLDEEIIYAKKTKIDRNIDQSKVHQGIYYSVTSDHTKALEVFTDLKDKYQEEGNEERVSVLLQNMSGANRALGNYSESLANQMESIKLKEELGGNPVHLANSYFTVGSIHNNLQNYTKSIEWLRKAYSLYDANGVKEYAIKSKHIMGLNLMELDSFEIAESSFLEAAEFYRAIKSPSDLSVALNNLGLIAAKSGDYDKAKAYYVEALASAELSGVLERSMIIYNRLGELYYKLEDYDQSIENLNKGLGIAKTIGTRYFVMDNYRSLAKSYKATENYYNAFTNFEQFYALKDSILSAENLEKISELEIKYESEKKEQEILLLKEKENTTNARNRGLMIGVGSLLALIGLLLYAMSQRAKKNRLQQEKMDQELAFEKSQNESNKKELTAFALQLVHKNEVLEQIKQEVINIKEAKNTEKGIQQIVHSIDLNKTDDDAWDEFRNRFLAVHKNFEADVKKTFPEVTHNELKVMSLMKMNLSSKEMANILNISQEGIKKARYRLRKKLGLETADSLEDFVIQI